MANDNTTYDFLCGEDAKWIKLAVKNDHFHTMEIQATFAHHIDLFGGTNKVEEITFSKCLVTSKIIWPADVRFIKRLKIHSANELLTLDLSMFENLEELSILNCSKLMSITGLSSRLKYLSLHDTKISTVDISACTYLETLNIHAHHPNFLITINNHEHLKIVSIKISKTEIKQLSNMIKCEINNCKSLECLNIDTKDYLSSIQLSHLPTLKLVNLVVSDKSEITNPTLNKVLVKNDEQLAEMKKIISQLKNAALPHHKNSNDLETIIQQNSMKSMNEKDYLFKIHLIHTPKNSESFRMHEKPNLLGFIQKIPGLSRSHESLIAANNILYEKTKILMNAETNNPSLITREALYEHMISAIHASLNVNHKLKKIPLETIKKWTKKFVINVISIENAMRNHISQSHHKNNIDSAKINHISKLQSPLLNIKKPLANKPYEKNSMINSLDRTHLNDKRSHSLNTSHKNVIDIAKNIIKPINQKTLDGEALKLPDNDDDKIKSLDTSHNNNYVFNDKLNYSHQDNLKPTDDVPHDNQFLLKSKIEGERKSSEENTDDTRKINQIRLKSKIEGEKNKRAIIDDLIKDTFNRVMQEAYHGLPDINLVNAANDLVNQVKLLCQTTHEEPEHENALPNIPLKTNIDHKNKELLNVEDLIKDTFNRVMQEAYHGLPDINLVNAANDLVNQVKLLCQTTHEEPEHENSLPNIPLKTNIDHKNKELLNVEDLIKDAFNRVMQEAYHGLPDINLVNAANDLLNQVKLLCQTTHEEPEHENSLPNIPLKTNIDHKNKELLNVEDLIKDAFKRAEEKANQAEPDINLLPAAHDLMQTVKHICETEYDEMDKPGVLPTILTKTEIAHTKDSTLDLLDSAKHLADAMSDMLESTQQAQLKEHAKEFIDVKKMINMALDEAHDQQAEIPDVNLLEPAYNLMSAIKTLYQTEYVQETYRNKIKSAPNKDSE